MDALPVEDWGLIDYEEALGKQLSYVEKIAEDQSPGVIVLCSHPAVVTIGRQTQAGDVFSWQGPIKEVTRGGRATYHGPSQVVAYPIVNLKFSRHGRGPQEIRGFLRALEQAVVETMKAYGIASEGRSPQKKLDSPEAVDETGVWVGHRKVASLGIAVKKWVSFHGTAINLEKDPSAFQGMKPCGFSTETMTSVEELLGRRIDREEFKQRLRTQLAKNI